MTENNIQTISITREDLVKYYLFSYYFHGTIFNTIFRIVIGIIILIGGLDMYGENVRLGIGFGGWMIGFGIYYILMPFINVLFINKKPETYTVTILANRMTITENNSQMTLNLMAYPLRKDKYYFYIKFSNNTAIIFPIKQLSPASIDTFSRLISEHKMEVDLH